MRRIWKRLKQEEKGQSLVEFALLLPILLLMVGAVADIGWVVYQKIQLNRMAFYVVEGAREEDSTAAEINIRSYIATHYTMFEEDKLDIEVITDPYRVEYEEYIYRLNERNHLLVPMYFEMLTTHVEMKYEVDYLTPWGGIMMGGGNSFHLSARSTATTIMSHDSRD